MLPHHLTNFKIQTYYQNEPKFNGVYSRNDLLKIKLKVYVINLDENESIETHWIALLVNGNNIIYFNRFGVWRSYSKRNKKNKKIITNIYRIQAYDSIMYGYFCIGFIYLLLHNKSLLDYTNLFSPIGYEKNNKIILKYVQ